MKGKRCISRVQESRWVVRTGTGDACIAHPGVSPLKNQRNLKVNGDVDDVIIRVVNNTHKGYACSHIETGWYHVG